LRTFFAEYASTAVRIAFLLAATFVTGAFVLMIADAAGSGDWPGWDEGWALVTFPVGLPLVLAGALAAAGAPRVARTTAAATLAVWAWGAAVFVLWHAFG
jgi:hypothetical protein